MRLARFFFWVAAAELLTLAALVQVRTARQGRALYEVDNRYLGRKAGRLSRLTRKVGVMQGHDKVRFGQHVVRCIGRVQRAVTAREEKRERVAAGAEG